LGTEPADDLLSYGVYLRVPELLSLQSPVGKPAVHDELLFIILQQAQELWFKQLLHELKAIVALLSNRSTVQACLLLDRVIRVIRVLGEEVEVMETLAPAEFLRFRGLLTPSSGFESAQFREIELASGLRDEGYLRIAERVIDLERFGREWPVTLRGAFLQLLADRSNDPIDALKQLYLHPGDCPELYALAESLSEYEMSFAKWRFRHALLVERVIGDHAPGTGGSSGTSYLARTLRYRFFPELWEARNRITEDASRGK
jgi:tryptophan 2,3-dioxygenase